jgi:hypothetical protein
MVLLGIYDPESRCKLRKIKSYLNYKNQPNTLYFVYTMSLSSQMAYRQYRNNKIEYVIKTSITGLIRSDVPFLKLNSHDMKFDISILGDKLFHYDEKHIVIPKSVHGTRTGPVYRLSPSIPALEGDSVIVEHPILWGSHTPFSRISRFLLRIFTPPPPNKILDSRMFSSYIKEILR